MKPKPEQIDVPLPKTAEGGATLYITKEADGYRGGFHLWLPAVTCDGRGGLQKTRPTRDEAIRYALDLMQSTLRRRKARNKTEGERFRMVHRACQEFRDELNGNHVPGRNLVPTAKTATLPIKPPKVAIANEHGVYTRNCGAVALRIPKSAKAKASLTIAYTVGPNETPQWRSSAHYSGPGFGGGKEPWESDKPHPTREAAIAAGLQELMNRLGLPEDGHSKTETKARRAILDAIKTYQANHTPPAIAAPAAPAVLVEAEAVTLTKTEAKTLERCERTITQNLRGFVETGLALATIRDGRLYRATHRTFEEYCGDRWQIGRQYAYRLMDSAAIVKQLSSETMSPIGDKALPATESQARPLARVDEDQRAEVWAEILEKAKPGEDGIPRVTAALVEDVVRRWVTPGDELEAEPVDRELDAWDRQLRKLDSIVHRLAAGKPEHARDLAQTLRTLATNLEQETAKCSA